CFRQDSIKISKRKGRSRLRPARCDEIFIVFRLAGEPAREDYRSSVDGSAGKTSAPEGCTYGIGLPVFGSYPSFSSSGKNGSTSLNAFSFQTGTTYEVPRMSGRGKYPGCT